MPAISSPAKRGGRDQRLQHLVDRAQRVAGHDHQRKPEFVGQVGDVTPRRPAATSVRRPPRPDTTSDRACQYCQPFAEQSGVELLAPRPRGQMRGQRRGEHLRADPAELARRAGGLP